MTRRKAISSAELARRGWRRTDGTTGKLSAVYEHQEGWRISHCGHPTALHPYELRDPKGRMVLTGIAGPKRRADFGTAWDTLEQATAYVATAKAAPARPRGRPPTFGKAAVRRPLFLPQTAWDELDALAASQGMTASATLVELLRKARA